MKKELFGELEYKGCSSACLELVVVEEDGREIREGKPFCRKHDNTFEIQSGILNMLGDLPPEVAHEKEHAEQFDYLVTENGERHPINKTTINKFPDLFLSLPAGDGTSVFQPGGSFDNQAGNAERFFKTLDLLNLKGGERVLEVGASFGWASRRFAQRGCRPVALDVTNYMMAGDLYFEEDDIYFDRMMADMSEIPFKNNTFDMIFSHSVIHHCKDLEKLFREFRRVLKPGGRVVALCECTFGLFEDKSGKALQEAIDDGFNENAYTVPQWKNGARAGGFSKVETHFFSFIDDYVNRKNIRGAQTNFKLNAARWIQSRPALHKFVTRASVLPRILFRPKSWMMIATK